MRKAKKDPHSLDKKTKTKMYRLLREYDSQNQPAFKPDTPFNSLSGISLNVAQNCNMRCKYCYGAQGTYLNPGYMNYKTAVKSINWLVQHSEKNELSIVFFGGEPLLNFELIQKLCRYIAQAKHLQTKTFIYSITTNGTLLTPQINRFLNTHHFTVTISFDGGKKAQNYYRPMHNGCGSYQRVRKNVKRFLASRNGNATGRATLTSGNADWQYISQHFARLGFRRYDYAVVTDLQSNLFALSNRDYHRLCADLERQAEELIKTDHRTDPIGNVRIWSTMMALKSNLNMMAGCGAGRGTLAVSHEGELFPCHRFVGNTDFSFGKLSAPKYDIWNRFALMRNESSATCRSCWARILCGSGCLHDNLNHSGKLFEPDPRYCDELKRRIEMAIYAYDQIQSKNVRFQ
jgi:uncharacterized protein